MMKSKITGFSLFIFIFSACNLSSLDESRPAILSDFKAQQSALQALRWMEKHVDLLEKNKTDCKQMAQGLIQHYFDHKKELAEWKKNRAQEWIKARAEVDHDFMHYLAGMMSKGDHAYSFCSFFQSFRDLIQEMNQIGL